MGIDKKIAIFGSGSHIHDIEQEQDGYMYTEYNGRYRWKIPVDTAQRISKTEIQLIIWNTASGYWDSHSDEMEYYSIYPNDCTWVDVNGFDFPNGDPYHATRHLEKWKEE